MMNVKKLIPLAASLAAAVLFSTACKESKSAGTEDETTEEESKYPVYEASESSNPYSWVAVDDLGNSIDPDVGAYPDVTERGERVVAAFYFLWHGCHGYDRGANNNEVVPPSASDTQSPYDIQKLLDANQANPALGGIGVMHHWGEPYLGYYVANDDWVIRKHAQLLVDAGVTTAIVKIGDQGCLVGTKEGILRVPAVQGVRCVDTTGAGDTFAAGLIAGLVDGRSMTDCARLGCAAASCSIEEFGATDGVRSPEQVMERYHCIL